MPSLYFSPKSTDNFILHKEYRGYFSTIKTCIVTLFYQVFVITCMYFIIIFEYYLEYC